MRFCAVQSKGPAIRSQGLGVRFPTELLESASFSIAGIKTIFPGIEEILQCVDTS